MRKGRVAIAAASVLVAFAAAGLAQEGVGGEVLTGAAAFGDWTADAPGVRRHISAGDLEAADLSQSAANAPDNVARPEGTVPLVPEGFTAELVVSGLSNPRAIRFAPNGDLFVADSGEGTVRVYRFADGNATPAEEGVFATGLNRPYGIAFHPAADPEWVYVAEAGGLKRFAYSEGDLEATTEPEVILDDIPSEHHWTRDVVFSPDGETMYYSVGSGSNVGENMDREPLGGIDAWAAGQPAGVAWGPEERRAAVLALDPEGGNERYFATGLRNCAGMTLQPATGDIWCVVNERDALGNNVPFDYATAVREGAFYGWPWYYIGDNPDPRWDGARPDLAAQVVVPDVLFQAHSAPLNIVFSDSDAWGAEFKGDAFVAMHGSWNRGARTGYKVVRLPFDENGKATGEYEDFVTGFVVDDGNVWGRPVGVAIAGDGSLFVSEDGGGTIWKVSKD